MTNEEFQKLVLEKLSANETFQGQMTTFQQQVNENFAKVNDKLGSMDNRLGHLESDVTSLKSQVSENTQILKALEHKAEVYKADVDNLTHGIANLSGEVKSRFQTNDRQHAEIMNALVPRIEIIETTIKRVK